MNGQNYQYPGQLCIIDFITLLWKYTAKINDFFMFQIFLIIFFCIVDHWLADADAWIYLEKENTYMHVTVLYARAWSFYKFAVLFLLVMAYQGLKMYFLFSIKMRKLWMCLNTIYQHTDSLKSKRYLIFRKSVIKLVFGW